MKRFDNIYSKICEYDNIVLAHKKARKGKGHYKDVKLVNSNEEFYLRQIQSLLLDQEYKTSEYVISKINDRGKDREIYKLPYFPDRIVQWAIMLQIEEVFIKNFIYDTYAAIPNKGTHIASKRLSKWLKDYEDDTKYCFKMDVKKFFPNINHDILKTLLRKKFKDQKLLFLLDEIIDSVEDGIPIGNYLSQYLANFYLSCFDHWVKEVLDIKYYMRYMDDIVILHPSKEYLHNIKFEIERYLNNNLKLIIKENWQVFPVDSRGIDFLGYRHFRNYKLLRKSTCINFKKKMIKFKNKEHLTESDKSSISAYDGWLKWCNSYNLKNKYLGDLL